MNFYSLEKHNNGNHVESYNNVTKKFPTMYNNSNFNYRPRLIDLNKDETFLNRKLNTDEHSQFKLNGFCVNLKNREANFKFIKNEWNDYINVRRFNALSTASESHYYILDWLCKHKDRVIFPFVVMEDDVYRKDNFTYFWNKLKNVRDVDYVAFDNIFIEFDENNNELVEEHEEDDELSEDDEMLTKDARDLLSELLPWANSNEIDNETFILETNYKDKLFVEIEKHRSMGFIVYYKSFFDKYEKDRHNISKSLPIDMILTHRNVYNKFIPKRQVCQQIVKKYSTTSREFTDDYQSYYDKSKEMLLEKYPDL